MYVSYLRNKNVQGFSALLQMFCCNIKIKRKYKKIKGCLTFELKLIIKFDL